MSQVHLFSSGTELANLVVTSDLLELSRDAILDLYKVINQNQPPSSPASVKVSQQANCTIIAVVTKDHLQGGEGELISSSTSSGFEFLCTTSNPSVTINKAALDLFHSIQTELSELPEIKDLINANSQKPTDYNKSKTLDEKKKTLLITGHSLGGSVASLFTLWLLDKFKYSNTKRPLCLTFGSPFIGDGGLREAILKYSTWNTCFLHVVSDQDPVPRVLISPQNPHASEYKPFGTFLLCSELGCACFEDSESILELLKETNSEGAENQNPNQGLQFDDVYDQKTVKHLNGKVICKDTTKLVEGITIPLRVGIYTPLVAIGRLRTQQQQQQNIDSLIERIEKQERKLVMGKKQFFDPSKKLNDMKIHMTQMEWYKKESKKNGGYYDSYKRMATKTDVHVEGTFKKKLTIYWENLVNEVKSKPQKEGASFRIRWLFAGTNYRRMIEPLDIADYYSKGEKDYKNKGRPEHYKLLEEWLGEEKKPASPPNDAKKQNVESILTEDSCFWAHVEEALISCKLLNSEQEKDSSKENLKKFEDYVLGLITNYAVSPEIFLPRSSFMQWWEEYKQIIRKEMMGISYTSSFTELMNTGKYKLYESGGL